jgi:homoserine kinase type II
MQRFMAVFTELTEQELRTICQQFQLGELTSFAGIAAGMENSNYFLHCEQKEQIQSYVLTVFEELKATELPFYLTLLATLKENGLAVAAPIADKDGHFIFECRGKPAIICPKLNGGHPEQTTPRHCEAIGEFLGRFHLLTNTLNCKHPGIRSFDWLNQLIEQSQTLLSTEDLSAVLHCYKQFLEAAEHKLPQGVIHADLFRDNALFEAGKLSGVLDFYSASEMYYIFDLAVVINDWCRDNDSPVYICAKKRAALVAAYKQQRALSNNEQSLLPLMEKTAAMRFWLSRLQAEKHSHEKALGVKKAPEEYRALFYSL